MSEREYIKYGQEIFGRHNLRAIENAYTVLWNEDVNGAPSLQPENPRAVVAAGMLRSLQNASRLIHEYDAMTLRAENAEAELRVLRGRAMQLGIDTKFDRLGPN